MEKEVGPEGGREDEETRMELTFLSSDGRSRQGMCAWPVFCDGRERKPLYWFVALLIRSEQEGGG